MHWIKLLLTVQHSRLWPAMSKLFSCTHIIILDNLEPSHRVQPKWIMTTAALNAFLHHPEIVEKISGSHLQLSAEHAAEDETWSSYSQHCFQQLQTAARGSFYWLGVRTCFISVLNSLIFSLVRYTCQTISLIQEKVPKCSLDPCCIKTEHVCCSFFEYPIGMK